MPGSTGEGKDDKLNQSFRADKIEFMVMQRELSADKATQDYILQEVGDVEWEIPTQEE